jgi:hypothetical protein
MRTMRGRSTYLQDSVGGDAGEADSPCSSSVEKQPIDGTVRAFGRWILLEEEFMACDCAVLQEWNVSV